MKNNCKISRRSAIFIALFAAQTYAQERNDQDLDEVLVTVQKREQNAQRVPVTVTAFSAERLNELGVTDVFDLQSSAPALQITNTQSAATTAFSVRGLGTSSQNFGLESSVGLYVDGVYRSRQSSVVNELVDVQAIEVARGPQGTLFGRNTLAGAVQIKSVAPNHDSDGFVSLSAGNYGLLSASLAVGGSLSEDVLAYRITGFTTHRDGFVSDLNFGEDLLNDRNRSGGRLQLLYTPAGIFSARLIADYAEIDEVCCAGVTVRNNQFGFDGRIGSDLLLEAFGANVVSQDRVFDDVTALNSLPVSQNEDAGVSLEMKWGDENDTQLTSITAYRTFDQFTDTDADFSDLDLFTRREASEISSFSQEIRFTKELNTADYLLGAYYFDQSIDSGAQFTVGPSFSPFLQQDVLIGGLINVASAFGLPVAEITPSGTGARDNFIQDQQSTALFGQLNYYISDVLTLTTGLRYTKEKKEVVGTFEQDNTGPDVNLAALAAGDPSSIIGLAFPGWGYTLGGPLTVVSARDNISETLDDSQVTGTVKLAYNPDKQSFYYVAYSTGYKSGGTNTDRIAPQFETVFDAETSSSFELGLKKDFPLQSLRLNISLHNTIVEDFQTVAFAGNGFSLTNAGEIETRGGELELIWYPTNSLSVNAAVSINDGRYNSFTGATCWIASPFLTGQIDTSEVNGVCDRSGEPISFNPEEMFMLSLDQQFSLGERYGYLHADYFYRSSAFEDGDLDPLKEQGGYDLLNLKAGMFFANGSTEVALWVRNALDEDYLGIHYDVPLQTGKLNSYAQEPRTYGISIRRNF